MLLFNSRQHHDHMAKCDVKVIDIASDGHRLLPVSNRRLVGYSTASGSGSGSSSSSSVVAAAAAISIEQHNIIHPVYVQNALLVYCHPNLVATLQWPLMSAIGYQLGNSP